MLFPRVILHWIGAQESVANEAAGYFQLFAISAPLVVMSNVSTAAFRSLSDTRTPMIITMGAVALNTLLGFLLVLGISPFPKLGVLGAGVATLLAQAVRCLILLVTLFRRSAGPRWRWPWQSSGTAMIAVASGLAPAAVASIGQAIGAGSIPGAKKNAALVIRPGFLAGLLFTIFLISASFWLSTFYPRVGKDVLQIAFWGLRSREASSPRKSSIASLVMESCQAAETRNLFSRPI